MCGGAGGLECLSWMGENIFISTVLRVSTTKVSKMKIGPVKYIYHRGGIGDSPF